MTLYYCYRLMQEDEGSEWYSLHYPQSLSALQLPPEAKIPQTALVILYRELETNPIAGIL